MNRPDGKKSIKDPFEVACGTGCSVGCGVLILTAMIGGHYNIDAKSTLSDFFFLYIPIAVGMIAFFVTKKIKTEESERENQAVKRLVQSELSKSVTPQQSVDQSIQLMCRATYFGGDKKYGDKGDVTVVLTKDRILVKELPGFPYIRIDIPYVKVTDLGLADKEQLTLARMLMVGIFAFALKKKQQYLYIKYKDQLGFENNPVFGEFFGSPIADVSSTLYSLIKKARGV